MSQPGKTFFLDTVISLRTLEEITLHSNTIAIDVEEELLVEAFLKKEYTTEIVQYPYKAPEFVPEAALWGAKVIYLAAQLLLYRKHKEAELPTIFPAYTHEITPAALLSADLCLRFLPQIFQEASLLDAEDALVAILEEVLHNWHYSAIGSSVKPGEQNLGIIFENDCLRQLYIDRIIAYKVKALAELGPLKQQVMASLGNHSTHFWKEL